jgi:DNA-binding protein HU-beta
LRGPVTNLHHIEKTCEKAVFWRFFRFTSLGTFRMIVTTQEQAGAYEARKHRAPAHVLCSEKLIQGGLMATIQRMTQTQLIRGLAEKGEVTNKQSRAMLEHLSSLAIAEVKKNGVFVLPGIGRLVRVDRKARMGRNPATGESIKIPAKKVVKFRVAKAAKDAIVPPKKK